MVQNGAEIVEFEEPMIFRFISEENWNTDEQSIYVWSNGEWREYLSQFSKKGAQTSINHTGTLAVFNHSTFQESEEREKNSDLNQVENSENESEISNTAQDTHSESDSSNSIYWMIGILLIVVIIGLLISFHVKKSR